MNIRFAFAAVASLMIVACGGSQQAPETEKPATQEQSLGQPCGSNSCSSGEFCCNESCGICAPKGGSCTQQICEPGPVEGVVAPSTEESSLAGQPCGNNSCGAGEFCCNESCGICAPKGGFCTQQVCEPTTAGVVAPAPEESSLTGQPCGTNTCGTGTYCCNESCGICAPKGASCTQQYCPPPV